MKELAVGGMKLQPLKVLLLGILLIITIVVPLAVKRNIFDIPEIEPSTIDGNSTTVEPVQCVLFVIDEIPESDKVESQPTETWTCVDTSSGVEYSIRGLGEDFFEKNVVISGVSVLTIYPNDNGDIIHHTGVANETQSPSSSVFPSDAPTEPPSTTPTIFPTKAPTNSPTAQPIIAQPTMRPTTPSPTRDQTTKEPTQQPTRRPVTTSPTASPTSRPTLRPTINPTRAPTQSPTESPTQQIIFDEIDATGSLVDLETDPDAAWTTKIEGRVSMLVVRVRDRSGLEPDLTAAEISDVYFGTFGDQVNLRSQYLACSGGKLDFVPAQGQDIVDGVLEVTINESVAGIDRSIVQGWVSEAVPSFLNGRLQSDFDYTTYVFPPGADFRGAGGYAAVGGRLIVMNNRNVATVLVQMHEVGHSLGLRHSGYDGLTYGDTTCMEGAHLYEWDAPEMCFNGAKSWYLGWYNDDEKQGHQLIRPLEGSWTGKLTGINDYIHSSSYNDQEFKVVLKIEALHETTVDYPDFYVMFNRKEGMNKGVQGFGDMVTVVSQHKEWGAQSWLDGTLDGANGSNTFRHPNFDDSGFPLVVQVCDITFNSATLDYATVIVYLDADGYRLSCDNVNI